MWSRFLSLILCVGQLAHAQNLNEISKAYEKNVKPIFSQKCFDCHSSTPHMPWYAAIPGPKGFIKKDQQEALADIDMTPGFPFLGKGTPSDYLDVIEDAVNDGSMPPFRYWILHWKSRLTPSEKAVILEWVRQSRETLKRDPGQSH